MRASPGLIRGGPQAQTDLISSNRSRDTMPTTTPISESIDRGDPMFLLRRLFRFLSFVVSWGLIALGVWLLWFGVARSFENRTSARRMTVAEIVQSPPRPDETVVIANAKLEWWHPTHSQKADGTLYAVAGSNGDLYFKFPSGAAIQDSYTVLGTVTSDELRKELAGRRDADEPPRDRPVLVFIPNPEWGTFDRREPPSTMLSFGGVFLAVGGLWQTIGLVRRRFAAPAVGSPCAGCGALAALAPVTVWLEGARGTRNHPRYIDANGTYSCCDDCRGRLRSLGWMKVVLFLFAFAATIVAAVIGYEFCLN
jgi:hypothetical protein